VKAFHILLITFLLKRKVFTTLDIEIMIRTSNCFLFFTHFQIPILGGTVPGLEAEKPDSIAIVDMETEDADPVEEKNK
jgi:hypothetical protein